MGLAPLTLWLACLLAVRNQRILTAWDARQAGDARRAAAGLRPRPAAGAARPAPASPPPQHRHNQARPAATISATAGQTTQTTARKAQHPALTNRISQTASTAPSLEPPRTRVTTAARNWLWHKDRDAVTYSHYPLRDTMVIAIA